MKLATLRIDGGTRAAVLGNGSAVLLDASCVGDLIAAEGWRAGVDAVLGDHGGDAVAVPGASSGRLGHDMG